MTTPTELGRGRISISRVLSLVLAVVYVITAFIRIDDFRPFLYVLVACVFLVACIWIPETMGQMRPLQPTRWTATPAPLVWIFGWICLLLPLVFGAYWLLTRSKGG